MAWMLKRPQTVDVFAAGHGESGNDPASSLSTTVAERVDGGWKINGRKMFGSLSPVWTCLGVHAMDVSDPARSAGRSTPSCRATPRATTSSRRGTRLGMRATASHDTRPRRRLRAGRADIPLVTPGRVRGRRACSTSPSSPGRCSDFANVYTGVAHRAYDLTVAQRRTRRTRSGSPARWRTTPRCSTRGRRCACRSRRSTAYLGPVGLVERRRPR